MYSAAQPVDLPPAVISGRRIPRRSRVENHDALKVVFDPLRLTLFLTTILTVSRIHQHYSILAKFRPVLVCVLAAGAYAYLNPRYLTRANVLRMWPMRLVALLGVLACGSAVFGISLGATAKFILGDYMKTVIFSFLIAVAIRNVRDLYTFVWAYVISCGILVFLSLFVFKITQNTGSYVTRLDHLDTYDSNDLCVVLMIGLALTLLLLTVARGKERFFLFLNIIGIAASIARSGSRGGFIGIVVFAVASLFLINTVSATRRISFLAVAAAALILGAPPGYWVQMNTVLQPTKDYNYSARDGRKALIGRGIGYMSAYPVFGLGINNFSRAECTISPKLAELARSGPVRCTAPHNSYLQAGAELGVPGLVTWSSIVLGSILALLRLRRRLPRVWISGTPRERFIRACTTFFPLATIGFAVTAFFVSFAWMDPVYIIAALVTGWYVAVREEIARLPAAQAASVAIALGLTRRTQAGWRIRRSARWLGWRTPLPAGE